MAAPPRAGLTAAEGRRFARTLAAGFAALGAVLLWRDHGRIGLALWALALLLLVAGAVAPARLGPVARAWTALGLALSRVTTPVFFTLLYLLVLTPMGVIRRLVSRSPLARSSSSATYWMRREARDPEAARRQLEHQF